MKDDKVFNVFNVFNEFYEFIITKKERREYIFVIFFKSWKKLKS
jgi:hypothetical protein